jgi:hypothetical protein
MVWSGKIRRWTTPPTTLLRLTEDGYGNRGQRYRAFRRKPLYLLLVTDRSYEPSRRVPRSERSRRYSDTNTSRTAAKPRRRST